MNEDIQLLKKFHIFFYEVLPLFGVKDATMADQDLSDPQNIHTIIFFLTNQDTRAMIVHIKSNEDGQKRFFFHLSPKDVGNVQAGFTLIKRVDYEVTRKFKHVFHALSLEPFLVSRIDSVLFEELLQSLHANNQPKDKDDLNQIFTFGQENSIIKEVESDKYISIQEHSTPQSNKEESCDQTNPPFTDSVPTKTKPKQIEYKSRNNQNKLRNSQSSITNKSANKSALGKDQPDEQSVEKKPLSVATTPQNKAPSSRMSTGGGSLTKPFRVSNTPDKVIAKRPSLNKSGRTSRNASAKILPETTNVIKYEPPQPAPPVPAPQTPSLEASKVSNPDKKPASDISNSQSNSSQASEKRKKKQIYVLENLDVARDGIRNHKGVVPEITTYHVPTKTVEIVMQAVTYLMTGRKLSWVKIKTEMKRPTWLKDILDLTVEQVEPAIIEEVIREYLMSEDWEPASIGNVKPSKTKAFAEWVETFCWELRKKQPQPSK